MKSKTQVLRWPLFILDIHSKKFGCQIQVFLADIPLVVIQGNARVIHQGDAFIEKTVEVEADAGHEVLGHGHDDEMNVVIVVTVDAGHPYDIAGDIEHQRVLGNLEGVQVHVKFDPAFQTEYEDIAVEAERILEYFQFLVISEFRYEEVVAEAFARHIRKRSLNFRILIL